MKRMWKGRSLALWALWLLLLDQAPAATHWAGDGSLLFRYTDCTQTNYHAVCTWYTTNGYTLYCEDATAHTLSKTFVKGDAFGTVFYKKGDGQLHVTASEKGGSLLPTQITSYEKKCTVTLTQPYTTAKGTCAILRLADGRVKYTYQVMSMETTKATYLMGNGTVTLRLSGVKI